MSLVAKLLISITAVCLLSGCVSTGIRVGNVYIPVDTGIGKEKTKKEESEEEQGVERGLPPKSKKTQEDEDEQTEDGP